MCLATKPVEFDGVSFSESGVYFMRSGDAYPARLSFPETIHKLSGKYVEGMGWSETGEEVIYENEDVAFTYDANCGYSWTTDAITTHLHNLVQGEKYTVIFDGVAYPDMVALVIPGGQVCIGATPDAMTEDVPFSVLTWADNGVSVMAVYAIGDAESHSISISGEIIHPIDQKYLPKYDIVIEVNDIAPDNLTEYDFTVRHFDAKAIEDKAESLREPTILVYYYYKGHGSETEFVTVHPTHVRTSYNLSGLKYMQITLVLGNVKGLDYVYLNIDDRGTVSSIDKFEVGVTKIDS